MKRTHLILVGCLTFLSACDLLNRDDEFNYERQEEYNEDSFQEDKVIPSKEDRHINGDHSINFS